MFKPVYAALLLFVFGAFLSWIGVADMIFTAKAKGWPTVQGTVHTKDTWMRSGKYGSRDYVPLMRYYYEVNGKAYSAEKIRYSGMTANSKHAAMQMISEYSVGMPTTVYYDPRDPSNAVLQVGSMSHGLAKVGMGLGAFIFGLLLCHPVWKGFNSEPQAVRGW